MPRTRVPRPAPLPAQVRVAVHPPKETDAAGWCTLADRCIAAGVAYPTTIGLSPYLAQMTTTVAVVKTELPLADGGSQVAKANLLAGTRKLHGFVMGHGAWIDTQMAGMTPADASAYAATAGFTSAQTGTHPSITVMDVTNGPVGSLLLICEFPNPDGRCLSCTEYSTDGGHTYTRGPDTEKSHVSLPLVFTAGQSVIVRMRQFLRGTGYTPWTIVTIVVV